MQADVLIIGCGIAGAAAALRLTDNKRLKVVLVTRSEDPGSSNSGMAQGGIVTLGEDDSKQTLINDVIKAGAGINKRRAVEVLAEEGPELIKDRLINKYGLDFDKQWGLEAAHSRKRILHVGDGTGRAIMHRLLNILKRKKNIQILTAHTAVELVTFPHHSENSLDRYADCFCLGAYILNRKSKKVIKVLAKKTILASGGLGQIFLHSSNPEGARGDGLAMASRAGARLENCEFVQFHPTTLDTSGGTKFLISEAVRGEGAKLTNFKGERFIDELKSRDVVARAIYWQLTRNNQQQILLDLKSVMTRSQIKKRFPNIYRQCLLKGFDIAAVKIPVVPAAHYFCGGVLVDLWGKTSINNLYAVGEVSCSGVHGANRLASTSLLEGLVWGDRAGRDILSKHISRQKAVNAKMVPKWKTKDLKYQADPALIKADMTTVKTIMWHYVGLVRREYLLDRAIRDLRHLWIETEEFYRKARLTDELLGLRNSILAALIVARAARKNKTSQGCHFRSDAAEFSP